METENDSPSECPTNKNQRKKGRGFLVATVLQTNSSNNPLFCLKCDIECRLVETNDMYLSSGSNNKTKSWVIRQYTSLLIMESKIVVSIDMYRYFQNINPFFDIFKISIRSYRKILKKVGNTFNKFLDIPKGNFVTFLRQFLEKLVKNYPKNMKLF